MRITDQQIFDSANSRIQKARSDDYTASNRVSSGKRIEHTWDGSGDAGMITRFEQEAGRQAAIMTSAGKASDELSTVDAAMGQVVDSLTRARELATQMANATYGATDRANAALEIQQLTSSVVSALNSRSGDRYVFGGTKDNAPPFDQTGAYLGDTTTRQIEVAPGVLQDASLRADQAFKGSAGGLDILAELSALQTALATNNVAGVRTSVESMAQAVTQVTTFRSRAGAMMNVFDVASNTARLNRDAAGDSRSKLEDVDVFEAATAYAAAQRALEATMAATTKSFNLTLLDKL